MKATSQWAIHGLAIQVFLFHCAPYVGNDVTNAAMAPAKLKRNLTTGHSHMTSKSADYFEQLWNLKTE
jgi:hypothetical protein